MNCKPTTSDIVQSIQNHKAFHPVHQGMSREQSLEFLEFDNSNFIKDSGQYTLKDTNTKLKTTVTTRLADKTKRVFERGEGAAEIGNFIHSALDQYSKQILSEIEGKTVPQALYTIDRIVKKDLVDDSKTLDQQSRDNLFEIAKNQIKFVYNTQNTINQRNNQNDVPVIKTESLVIDPVSDEGGTIDFLGILSDNTFIIRDYKTISLREEHLDQNGNLRPDINLIHYKSLDKYKLQIQRYTKILIDRYGFKGVMSSRIIPIKSFTRFNKTTKKFDNNITYVAGPYQDRLIEDIIPFTEKTGFESLDNFLDKINERIKRLNSKTEEGKKDVTALKIKELENIKKEVIVKRSLNTILEYIKNTELRLKGDGLKELTVGELLTIKQELDLFKTIIESTHEYKIYLIEQGKTDDAEQLETQVQLITNAANILSLTIKEELFQKKLNHIVTEETGEKLFDEFGNIVPFIPEGYFAQWFYQLSQFQNPIFQTLKAKLDNAYANKHDKLLALQTEVIETEREVLNVLKQKGMSWTDFMNILLNDKDNLVTKLDKQWFESLNTLPFKELPKYFVVSDYYDFNIRRNEFIVKLKDQFSDDLATQDQELLEYDKKYNLSLDQNNEPVFPTAWLNAKNRGKLLLKEDKIKYSVEFNKIKSVPEFFAYYNLLEKYNKEFRKILGVDFKKLPNNFIPNIRKNTSERIDEWGVFKGTGSSVNDFFQNFSIREDDRTTEDSYLKRDSIPRFFLNPFTDKEGNIIKGEKSYQLGRSLLLFAKMVYNYEEMSKIEAEVLALREFLVEKGEEVQLGKDGLKVNLLGNIKTLPNSDLANTFDKFVQMYLYGIHVEPVLDDKSGKYEKVLLEAKKYFTLKKLGLNIISATGGYFAAKIQAIITGKTGIYYNEKQYNQSLKDMVKNREKFLALSAFFDPMGHRYENIRLEEGKLGEVQLGDTTQHGWINQYINSRLLMKPYSLGDENIEEVVTYAAAQNYYVNEDGILKKARFEEDYIKYKGKFIIDLFKFEEGKTSLNLPENQSKAVWIAFRNAVQVIQSGIKGTIPDQDKAVWQGQLAGHLLGNFKSWIPGVMTERFGKVKYDKRADTVYMGRFTAVMQEFGNQKNNKKNEVLQTGVFIKDIVLPKLTELLMQVASFHSIGGYFNGYKMKDDGTVRLMFEQWLRQNPHFQGKVTYDEFRDIQQKQLKASIVEMRIILTFMLLSILAMGDWDDDGEKDYRKYFLSRKLVSVVLKVKQEISFFVNPTEFVNLTKNPIPMIGLLQDAVKTISNTADELYDVTLNQSVVFGKNTNLIGDDKQDKKNLLSYTHTWVPGIGGLFQFLDILSDDVQYASQQ